MTGTPTHGAKTILHNVTDLPKAKAVYTALLGVEPTVDSEYYVGYDTAGQHIGLAPAKSKDDSPSPVAYWHVDDIEARIAEITAAGGTVAQAPKNVGEGRLVATVTDLDGNTLGLLQDP
ncbi:MAG TPA: VOC family protein [Phytomonospora sp.]